MRNVAMWLCVLSVSGYRCVAQFANSYHANLHGALAATIRHAGYNLAILYAETSYSQKRLRHGPSHQDITEYMTL